MNANLLTSPPKPELLSPNPEIVTLIAALVAPHIDETTEEEIYPSIILEVTKSVLTNPMYATHNGSMQGPIFAYYLEAYDTLRGGKIQNAKDHAIASLFRMYDPFQTDHTLRQLMLFGINAVHEMLTIRLSSDSKADPQALLSRIINVAIIEQAVRWYTYGARRPKSKPLMDWIADFVEKAMASPDLAFVEEDTFKGVIEQLKTKRRVVKIP